MEHALSFHVGSDRLPPQSVEAEEAILGGILLDPEALTRVLDILRPDAFYIKAHREIYRASLALHHQGRPTDLMSVTAWLRDHDLLEHVGGQGQLSNLVDRTVSAVNIDQYAQLVVNKYIRRKLIETGHQIAELGYENTERLEEVLDKAEQKLFTVTQDRPQQGLKATADILTDTFSEIESRALGTALSGLPCNFYDLDAMTQGFQRSDLVIVAGRPSMGKTSFVLNIARNIAAVHKLPVAIFSLEMSKEQLVYRLLSGECGIESGRLRSGRVNPEQWEVLGHAISRLSELDIHIDDTPNMSVTEMRSKVRRLQAERGGELGLVMIDYLQLMEGGSTENRVQELSRISRSLKGMARELRVPVLALSQLSRSVESRTNKRPMMSDLRESGALEQDADLILMLYRDEYYNPDTVDRGITEVLVVKHRNGPTGTVKLLFDPQFTRFRNIANPQRPL
jgi:replicative DNA helicase